jgi:hypothetical protein
METRWIKNRLTASGPQSLIRQFVDRAEGVYHRRQELPRESVFCFNSFVELPNSASFLDELAEWGCKWGSYNARLSRTDSPESGVAVAEYSFNTPWTAPLEFFHKVARKFPSISLKLEYFPEDREFEGKAEWVNGVLTVDECKGAGTARQS